MEITTKPLDIFAKLFNTGYRRPTKQGDEWRVGDLDQKAKLASDIIKKHNLPLTLERNVSLNRVRGFLVKEV